MSSSIPSSSPGKAWQPPSLEALESELPQYEIEGLLGRGGMGAVYKARQKSLNREVAIKVLPPTIEDGDMHFAERFKAEAQVMARLNHPGIIAVYDAGETPGGLLYFVMEYVQGTDVQQMLASSGRLPQAHVHAIAASVCDALAYAHSNGLIHRDIKPANIMVDTQGRVKVADFGLAKSVTENNGFTQSNMAVGTPDFVAPEALIGGMPVDGRADLYAMGVMIYQMLTGNIPRGAWYPPSMMLPGEVDPRFDEMVVKAMQVDRERRHSSAMELREHLDSVLIPMAPAAPERPVNASTEMAEQAAVPAEAATAARVSRPTPSARPKPRTPVVPPKKSSAGLKVFMGLGAAVAAVVAFMVMKGSPKPEAREESGAALSAMAAPQGGTTPQVSGQASANNDRLAASSSTLAAAMLTGKDSYINSLGMKFVPVKGTEIMFCIHETRYKDYAAYAAAAPGVDGTWRNQMSDGFTVTERKEDHPVTNVNYDDAQLFCVWLSKQEGKTYRLPTDQEWSFAAGIGFEEKSRAGTPAKPGPLDHEALPWGMEWPPPNGSGNYSDQSRKQKLSGGIAQYVDGYDDGYPTSAPVMSFKPNKLGLYDMSGNQWEWVEGWYDYRQQERVLRGASFIDFDRGVLFFSSRGRHLPDKRFPYYGFRCVLELSATIRKASAP